MKKLKYILSLALALSSLNSFGQGIPVYDAAGWMKTYEIAVSTAQQASYLKQQLNNFTNIQGTLNSVTSLANLAGLQDKNGLSSNLSSLISSTTQLQNIAYMNAQNQSALGKVGLGLQAYTQLEAMRAAAGNVQSALLINQSQAVMQRVNQDAAAVQQSQQHIEASQGTLDSLKILNSQTNKLVAQNIEIMNMQAAATAATQQQAQLKYQDDQVQAAAASAVDASAHSALQGFYTKPSTTPPAR
jgi:hypothetical protein